MAKKYIFDKESFSFKKVGSSVGYLLRRVLKWTLGAVAMAVLYYLVFSMVFNTDTEEQLSKENEAYAKEYASLQERQRLLSDITRLLQARDDAIYKQVFHTEAPQVDPSAELVADTDPQEGDYGSLVSSNRERLLAVSSRTSDIENSFRDIFDLLAKDTIPPMASPVRNLSYVAIGASVGLKYNPFYKVDSRHDGLDIIAAQGEEVMATADGLVTDVKRSAKGLGNVVTIDHGNGFVTRYAHLASVKAEKGNRVKRGEVIAEVGISGKVYVPHLHYEVLHHGVPQDPVHFLFADLSPQEYSGVAFMAEHTEQSLD